MEFTREKWRVTGGKHHYVSESGKQVTLRKGDTFHPTKAQIQKGSLENKAVPLGESRTRVMAGADIGLRTLPWGSKTALKKALDAGLSVEDFEGMEPGGTTGYVTADVNDVLAAKS